MEFLLLIIPFLIRYVPRYFNQNKIDADTWYHLSSSKSIVNNNYKIPKINDGFILGGKYDYPYFSHWIVAIISRGNVLKYEKYIAPILDSIYIFMALIYFQNIVEFYQISDGFSKSITFILLLSFSMSMLKISTGPRVYNFTPRVFGELFTFIYFISIHLFFLEENMLYLFISIFFGGLVLITSKFGVQVLVFFSLLLSIFLFSLIPFLCLLVSFIVALLLSNWHYKNIFIQQFKHMKQYALYGQYNHPALKNRNKLSQYILFGKTLLRRDLKEAYIIFQRDLVFLNIFYKNIDVIIALGLIFFVNIQDDFLMNILIVGLIIFILTSYKPFQFLGESDRYLDYLLVFSVIVIVLYLPQEYIYFLLIVEFIFYILTLVIYFKSSSDFGEEFILATNYIRKNIKNKSVIHGIIGMYINYPLYLLTGINTLAIEANYVFNLNKNKKLMPKAMFYTKDFDYLYNEYGVNIIIANKKYLHQDIQYDFSKFNLFYENKQYVVYIRKEI